LGKDGPKLKESPASPDDTSGAAFGISMNGTVGRLEVKRGNMTALANTLPRFVGRPVVDLTGLTSRYDFDLEFSRDDVNGMMIPPTPASPGPPVAELGVSIFTSIQRVGLKLDPRRLPLDAVVVEGAEKTPVEN